MGISLREALRQPIERQERFLLEIERMIAGARLARSAYESGYCHEVIVERLKGVRTACDECERMSQRLG